MTDLGQCDCACWAYQQLKVQRDRLHDENARLQQELRIAFFDAEVPVRELRESVAGYVARTDAMAAEIKRLRAAIEDYRLWEPGRAGHAAAHRKLMEALDA